MLKIFRLNTFDESLTLKYEASSFNTVLWSDNSDNTVSLAAKTALNLPLNLFIHP